MQQNVCLFCRRGRLITRLRSLGRSQPHRHAFVSTPQRAIHQNQQWRLNHHQRPAIGLHLGTLPLQHLGGQHYFRVKIPEGSETDNADAWLRALDTCLPPHLRSDDHGATLEDRSTHTLSTRRDVALLLIQAQRDASFNLVEHLGIAQQRWDAVSWIVQTIAEPGLPRKLWSKSSITALSTTTGATVSLDEFTEAPGNVLQAAPTTSSLPLNQATIDADPRLYDTRLQRGALGQIWQALGNMIVQAAEATSNVQSIMPRILSLLATLHHYGIVPESVYREAPENHVGSVQQPPLLHMLSSKILTALSDAAWDARQVAVNNTEKSGKGRYLPWSFGLESPGVRYRASSQELRPEVWLELVLWSCLHGGWVAEGATILDQVTKSGSNSQWSLICWQEVINGSTARQTHSPSFGWRDALDILEGARPEAQPRPSADDKASVVRTVSSEVVAAYVDALVSSVYVGVGQRGTHIRTVIDHVSRAKTMLSKQNLGLGFATWDVIVQRFMESGGVWLERDLRVTLDIFKLVDPYGTDQQVANLVGVADGDLRPSPYFIEASALPLNILHRILNGHARSGNLDGTLSALKILQDFTELNQRRSIEQFFRELKTRPQTDHASHRRRPLFDTSLAAAEYPSFYPQLPIHVLGRFLDIAKNVKEPEFYNWIFKSDSVHVPLISTPMYAEAGLAPALVRFATATDDQAILEAVMAHHSKLDAEDSIGTPAPILTALAESLIQRRKWLSVRNLISTLIDHSTSVVEGYDLDVLLSRLLPVLTRELLHAESTNSAKETREAAQLFKGLAIHCLGMFRLDSRPAQVDELLYHTTLLASVNARWGKFVRTMQVLPTKSIPLRGGTIAFNWVLRGIVETRGLLAARHYWDLWCYSASIMRKQLKLEGGYLHVLRERQPHPPRNTEPDNRVLIAILRNYTIDLVGRVRPNLYSVRLMQDAMTRDRDTASEMEYDAEDMEAWLREYTDVLSHIQTPEARNQVTTY